MAFRIVLKGEGQVNEFTFTLIDHFMELFAAYRYQKQNILNLDLKAIFLQLPEKAGPLAQLVRASDS
jgi:hypothetical protein